MTEKKSTKEAPELASNDQTIDHELSLQVFEDDAFTMKIPIINHDVIMDQKWIAYLYETTQQNVSYHIQNILKNENIDKNATYKEYLYVQIEGDREVKRKIKGYDIDMIVKIGLRMKSGRGKKLQEWRDNLAINTIKQVTEDIQNHVELPQIAEKIESLEITIQEQSNKIVKLEETNAKIINTYRIDEEDKEILTKLAKEHVMKLLIQNNKCDTDSHFDKTMFRITIITLWNDFKEHFKISKYSMLPKIEWSNALQFIDEWDNMPYDRFEDVKQKHYIKNKKKQLLEEIEKANISNEITQLAKEVLK